MASGDQSQDLKQKRSRTAYQKLASRWRRVESPYAARSVERSALIQRGIGPGRAFLTKFMNDWTMNLQASALAYHLAVALFPVLIFLFLLFKLILGNADVQVQLTFVNALAAIFPQALGSDMVNQLLQRSDRATGLLAPLAIIFSLIGGSRLFVLMENCFDLIYHQPPRQTIRQNVMAVGMLLLFTFLIPISLLGSSVPAVLLSLLNTSVLDSSPVHKVLVSILSIIGSLIISWLLFEAIYVIVPNQRISFRHSWRGALAAAVGVQLYLIFFPFYLTHFLGNYGGQVGFAIILIIFFYYFAVILLLGAQVNAFFSEGIQETPQDLASLVHQQTNLDPKPPEEQHVQATPEHKRDMDERE